MDILNRIKCDHRRGGWTVLFKGKDVAKNFKTSEEASKHLDDLLANRTQPVFA